MSDRRNFIKNLSAAGMLAATPDFLSAQQKASSPHKKPLNEKLWGCLLHLSYNFWVESSIPGPYRGYRPYLQLSESLWNDATDKMVKEGMNMVVIDLGDGVRYKSHPEDRSQC